MKIKLFSKDGCQPCEATKRALTKKGIEFETIDVNRDDSAKLYVADTLGYRGVPAVAVFDENDERVDDWQGFRPDLINEIAKEFANARPETPIGCEPGSGPHAVAQPVQADSQPQV